MPFKAHFKHEYWSVDVRYIEEHGLGFPEPIYLISILENYSRACLASKISATQNQWDYLEVLFAALSAFGAPSALVSDGGAIFRCNQAMDVYAALGIRKEQIDKRQAWQNYIESHFNTVRKMVDAKFARATSWEEMISVHRSWTRDYNAQRHFAHEKREDGCHSPTHVLGEQKRSRVSRIRHQSHFICDSVHASPEPIWVSACPGLKALRRSRSSRFSCDAIGLRWLDHHRISSGDSLEVPC